MRIQREFLWGVVTGVRKVCWVKWSTVCQPREKGGLGVRDVRVVNEFVGKVEVEGAR